MLGDCTEWKDPSPQLNGSVLTRVAEIAPHPHQVAPDTSPMPLLAPVVLCRGRKLVAELNWLDGVAEKNSPVFQAS